MSSLDQYWDVKPKQVLYSRDEYSKKHMIDVGEFFKVGIITSVIATISVLFLGVVMCLF